MTTKLYSVDVPVRILLEADSIEEARRTTALLVTSLRQVLPTGAALAEELGETLRRLGRQ